MATTPATTMIKKINPEMTADQLSIPSPS